jgi:ABC-type transport system substrate-binding protein
VKFHDGKEMTAEDVKWSIEYAMDPQNRATGLVSLKGVQAVQVRDKLVVEVVLKEIDATFVSTISSIRAFPVVPRESVARAGGKVLSAPPGTGPFVLKEHKAGREILFVRHKDYWQKGVPYLDEVVMKPVEEEQVRFASVRAGDLDIIERTPYAVVGKLLKGEYPQLTTTVAKYAGYSRILFNAASPPFNNVKLRQAVRYALDRQKYIEGAFWGLGEPTDQLMPKETPWHVKLPEVKRDVAKVKALLKEAGVGADFEVEFMGPKSEEAKMQVLQQQLSSAGVKTKLLLVDNAARRSRESAGDFMLVWSGSDIPNDPGEEYPAEFGCNEEGVKAKKRGINASGYCNREFDRLVEEAGKIFDPKRRYELYAKAARILHDEIPDIPLAMVPRFYTHQQKVRGFETDWDGRFNLTAGGLSRVWLAP